MRALAVVGKIISLSAIKDADRIMRAEVVCGESGKWTGVVGLNHHVGELVTVFLQDAILPPNDRWAFMEKSKWRVRMSRFRGCPSECLIISGAPLDENVEDLPYMPIGTDLTEALGVIKYEKALPASMTGEAVGNFPSFLPKTDEPNYQTIEWRELLSGGNWYATQKADGSSCTAWVDEDGLHVASRNLELREFSTSGKSNSYWIAARKYQLENMPVGIAIQFELIGEGIQSNPMGIKGIEGRMFGAFKRDWDGRWHRVKRDEFPAVMPLAELHPVEIYETEEHLRSAAEIKYANGNHGEGLVFRSHDQSWSFKIINLLYTH